LGDLGLSIRYVQDVNNKPKEGIKQVGSGDGACWSPPKKALVVATVTNLER